MVNETLVPGIVPQPLGDSDSDICLCENQYFQQIDPDIPGENII